MIGRVYTVGGLYWRVLARGEPFDRGPRRNVLVECVERTTWGLWATTWPRTTLVRPFRGLRRA